MAMDIVNALRTRTRTRLAGRLTSSAVASEVSGALLLARAALAGDDVERRLSSLAVAGRRLQSDVGRRALQRALAPWLEPQRAQVWRDREIGWDRYKGDFGKLRTEKRLATSLVLKAPRANGEKGVLYCSFEYNWMRLLAHHDARRFLAEWHLVGASSWSPPEYAVFANFAGLSADPLFIGISNVADLRSYALLAPTVRAVPLMACDWVDASMYAPKPRAERTIDILMVAHWAHFKRHWLLFEALRELPRDLRIVLIGRDAEGRTERELRAEARAFGVRQELEVVKNVSIEEVAAYQCDAKLAAQLSLREGSCVAVTEAMFADTPVAMMRDAHVGAKAHVNEQTGRLFSRRELGRGLARMLEGDVPESPRRWALANITAERSSAALNAMLREHETKAGRPWTADIAPLCWRYVPEYLDAADRERLAPAEEALRREHGIELAKFVFKPK